MTQPRRRPTTEPGPVPRDAIDHVVSGWAAARPELDVAPVTVVARLLRANALVRQEVEAVFQRHGLTAAGFSILAVLARMDGASPDRLAEELGVAPGVLRDRVDRMVREGFVRRGSRGPDTLLELSNEGREVFDACTPEHLENERRLLGVFTDDEREALAILLRKLVVSLETD